MKNNRTDLGQTDGTCASWCLAVLLALHFLCFPASWLGNAAGMPWGNLMSVEGIRWYCAHIPSILCTPVLAYVVPLIVLAGAVERSGVGEMLRSRFSSGHFHLTYRQRRALGFSFGFFLLVMVAVILSVKGPMPVLLSVTGRVYPSPFFNALYQSVPMGLTFAMMAYASLCGHLRGWHECLSVLYWGVRRHAVWLFITVLSVWLFKVSAYVCGMWEVPAGL